MIRAALVLIAAAMPLPALAQQAPNEVGKRAFQRCAACHSADPATPARFGPNLHGIVGRRVASLPGYAYSPALRGQKFMWTEAQLDKWLKSPRTLVPGTSMSFPGLSDAAERKALIAYLKNPSGR